MAAVMATIMGAMAITITADTVIIMAGAIVAAVGLGVLLAIIGMEVFVSHGKGRRSIASIVNISNPGQCPRSRGSEGIPPG